MNTNSLDMTYLKTISNGNKKFELKMLKTFFEQTTSEMEKIQTSFQRKEWDSLCGSAHKIKPSFHFMRESDMEKLLQAIEDSARHKNNMEKLPELISEFINSCEHILENVKKEIKKYSKAAK